jgi:hypothetical protein
MEFSCTVNATKINSKVTLYTVPFCPKYFVNIWFSKAKEIKGFILRFFWLSLIVRLHISSNGVSEGYEY